MADGLYLVVSRSAAGPGGRRATKVVGEIGRGEVVGEAALLTEQTRTATVVALRDSELLHLPVDGVRVPRRRAPPVLRPVAAQVVGRMVKALAGPVASRPVTTVACVPAPRRRAVPGDGAPSAGRRPRRLVGRAVVATEQDRPASGSDAELGQRRSRPSTTWSSTWPTTTSPTGPGAASARPMSSSLVADADRADPAHRRRGAGPGRAPRAGRRPRRAGPRPPPALDVPPGTRAWLDRRAGPAPPPRPGRDADARRTGGPPADRPGHRPGAVRRRGAGHGRDRCGQGDGGARHPDRRRRRHQRRLARGRGGGPRGGRSSGSAAMLRRAWSTGRNPVDITMPMAALAAGRR